MEPLWNGSYKSILDQSGLSDSKISKRIASYDSDTYVIDVQDPKNALDALDVLGHYN